MDPEQNLFSIGEVAKLANCSPGQLRAWEREGLVPPPSVRVQRGSRMDRRYTRAEVLEIQRLRPLYRPGAPTAEIAAERDRRKARFLT